MCSLESMSRLPAEAFSRRLCRILFVAVVCAVSNIVRKVARCGIRVLLIAVTQAAGSLTRRTRTEMASIAIDSTFNADDEK